MKPKLSKFLLFALFAQYSANAYKENLESPNHWRYGSEHYGGDNFILDAVATFHVTGIELGLCADGAIYTVNTLGDGVTRTPLPT